MNKIKENLTKESEEEEVLFLMLKNKITIKAKRSPKNFISYVKK